MKKTCLKCGKELKKGQKKFCSLNCQHSYDYDDFICLWKQGKKNGAKGKYGISAHIRRYLFEKYSSKCARCGWNEINPYTGKIPLEIEHIDGNYLNNNEDNLILLCPNCHSLTATYKGANRGKGRNDRQKYVYGEKGKENHCIDCGKIICKSSIRCKTCQGKHSIHSLDNFPISREELKNNIRTMSMVKAAEKVNLTDNGLRKWLIKFDLPTSKRIINSYSDEEWDLI